MFEAAFIDELKRITRSAGALALQYFNSLSTLEIATKGTARDLVSEADKKVESFLYDRLLALMPDIGFYGEESGIVDGKRGRWIVDPIDGTSAFTRGQYYWSISIALEIEKELKLGLVYSPIFNDLYFAVKGKGATKNGVKIECSKVDELIRAHVCTGFACLRAGLENNNIERFTRIMRDVHDVRRYGSCALDICGVAAGVLDLFWEQELGLYDIAAAACIAKEAGATVTDFSGNEGLFPKQVLVTNGKLLELILPYM